MEQIDKLLKQEVDSKRTPSVAYACFNENAIIHRFQYGFADIKSVQQVTESTGYHAYSVTKTFTAIAVLQLSSAGKLNIEDAVKKYLPEFSYGDKITIKQLLSHTAGIPNPIPLSWIHLANEHNTFNRDQFFSMVYLKNSKAKSAPNEKFAYSNLGYVILGQVIEQISGMRYEEYVYTKILQPLNITSSELAFTIEDFKAHAKGYQKTFSFLNLMLGLFIDKSKYMNKSEGKWTPFKENYVNGSSYGGLIGTPNAFVKYLQELMRNNCCLIDDEHEQLLFTENFTNSNKPTGMCLSWFTGKLNNRRYFTHAGGGGGYYCEIRIYPEINMGSVIMFNRTGISDERFLDKIDRYLLL